MNEYFEGIFARRNSKPVIVTESFGKCLGEVEGEGEGDGEGEGEGEGKGGADKVA